MVFNMKWVLMICLLRLFNNCFCVIFVLCIVFNCNINNLFHWKPVCTHGGVRYWQYCFVHTVVYTQRRWKHGGFRSKTVLETRWFPLRRVCCRVDRPRETSTLMHTKRFEPQRRWKHGVVLTQYRFGHTVVYAMTILIPKILTQQYFVH